MSSPNSRLPVYQTPGARDDIGAMRPPQLILSSLFAWAEEATKSHVLEVVEVIDHVAATRICNGSETTGSEVTGAMSTSHTTWATFHLCILALSRLEPDPDCQRA
jgi:hypothetical protein